jgi:hypothetical protein
VRKCRALGNDGGSSPDVKSIDETRQLRNSIAQDIEDAVRPVLRLLAILFVCLLVIAFVPSITTRPVHLACKLRVVRVRSIACDRYGGLSTSLP